MCKNLRLNPGRVIVLTYDPKNPKTEFLNSVFCGVFGEDGRYVITWHGHGKSYLPWPYLASLKPRFYGFFGTQGKGV